MNDLTALYFLNPAFKECKGYFRREVLEEAKRASYDRKIELAESVVVLNDREEVVMVVK